MFPVHIHNGIMSVVLLFYPESSDSVDGTLGGSSTAFILVLSHREVTLQAFINIEDGISKLQIYSIYLNSQHCAQATF